MPKRLLDRCVPDSIREFRAAARERARDAVSLAAAGRRTAAIYLWGYVAEMTLKAAYFGAIGFPETQIITQADLRAAASTAPQLGVTWPTPTRYHDLRAWAELLVAMRASLPGFGYPVPGFANEVLTRSRHLQRLWNEVLRYRKNVAYAYQVDQVRAAAHWLLFHSLHL